MKMKKLLSAALAAAMVLSLAACGKKDQPAQSGSQSTSQSTSQSASSQQADFSDVTIRAAAMNGPTGMGMALLADRAQNSDLSYQCSVTFSGSPDDVRAGLLSGELDIAAVPVNMAAALYNKTGGAVEVAAVNTLGVLYVVTTGDDITSVADLAGKTILPLTFTMLREEKARQQSYRTAAEAIEKELSAGRDVAMVNLGDVSVYATAYYILELVRDDGFEAVMLPGVTSFCAVAARLGRSLTRMDEPLHILPGSMDMDTALSLPGTKVLMKSGKGIHRVADALERRGLLDRAGLVADCGLETEQVYTDLRELPEEISYFATIVAD